MPLIEMNAYAKSLFGLIMESSSIECIIDFGVKDSHRTESQRALSERILEVVHC